MANSIDQMMGLISSNDGLMRSNLYLVTLPPSNIIQTGELNLLCKSVSIPGRQLQTTQRQIGMVNRNIATGYTNTDLTMTFRLMNNPKVLEYFNAWQSAAVDRENLEVGYYNDYVRDIQISILKKGVGLPLFKKQFEIPLPSNIRNRLPTIGPINFAQGEIDLNLLTDDKVAYKVRIQEAYPTSLMGLSLSDDNENGLVDLTVSFSFKDWTSEEAESPSGFINTLFEIFDKFKI